MMAARLWSKFLDLYADAHPNAELPDFVLNVSDQQTAKGSPIKASYVYYLSRTGMLYEDIGQVCNCTPVYICNTIKAIREALAGGEFVSKKIDLRLLQLIDDAFAFDE